jgi:Family of unknown function (DUF6627)
MTNFARSFIVRLASVALISMGFMQAGWAGMIGTDYMIESDGKAAALARLDKLLAQEEVAGQMVALGVDPADVSARLQGMTYSELQTIEGRIDSQLAGGDAIAVIGVLFLVLLILELVGVTDIFKSF